MKTVLAVIISILCINHTYAQSDEDFLVEIIEEIQVNKILREKEILYPGFFNAKQLEQWAIGEDIIIELSDSIELQYATWLREVAIPGKENEMWDDKAPVFQNPEFQGLFTDSITDGYQQVSKPIFTKCRNFTLIVVRRHTTLKTPGANIHEAFTSEETFIFGKIGDKWKKYGFIPQTVIETKHQ